MKLSTFEVFNAFSDELTLEDKFNMHLSCNKTPSQQHNLDHVIDVREEEETCVSSFSFYSHRGALRAPLATRNNTTILTFNIDMCKLLLV